MGAFRTLAPVLSLSVAAAAIPWPVSGQCRLCDKPSTAFSQSADGDGIDLDIATSLNFDRLVLAGNGEGSAVLRPDGSSAALGALTQVSARAMVGTAIVHGTAGRAIRVELPRRIELYSLGGGRIIVDDVASDLPSLPRLDSAGNLTFRFGGTIKVTGDSEGDYRGNLPITAEYQ